MLKPVVDKTYLLEKIQGKGGWTYAEIPEIRPDKHSHFGWVKVKGSIDNFEINQYNLQPLGNGNLFLPVKAAIRKKIGKQAGDFVHIKLFIDQARLDVPDEILLCFDSESDETKRNFGNLNDSEKKNYLTWINDAKLDETKINRIAIMMKRLFLNQKFGQ